MDKYYRNKVTIPKNEPLRFQILSWETFDKSIEEDSEDSEDLEYKIYAFGITDKEHSICVEINDYTPYFYAKIPNDLQNSWSDFKTKQLEQYLKKKLFRFKDSLLKVSVVLKKDLDGFTNEENFKFIKIITKNEKTYTKCKYILCPWQNRPKPIIQSISPCELNFILYEANVEPFIRFCHIQNIKLCGWCEIEKYRDSDNSRCQIDISCKWPNIKPFNKRSIAKFSIISFDIETFSERAVKKQKNIFPDKNLESDVIFQIGSTLHVFGTNEKIEFGFTLKSPKDNDCTEQDSIITLKYSTEKELLQGWIKFIRKIDPDVLTGYNINTFDWDYIFTRCKMLNIELDLYYLSRLYDKPAEFKEQKLKTAAYGENEFKFLYCYGIYNSDLYTIIKREQKLPSYKLDLVAKHYIADQKDPLSPLDLFNYSIGTANQVATVLKYCLKDCTLVINLILKLCIFTNNIGMANVTHVPRYLFRIKRTAN